MTSARTPKVDAVPDVPRRSDGRVDLTAMLRALQPAVLLESADGVGWSYVVPVGEHRVVDDGTRTTLVDGNGAHDLGTDPFDALDHVCAMEGLDPGARVDPDLPPFTGGLVGAFAYDLARRVERLPGLATRDRTHGDVALWFAEHVVAVSPDLDTVLLVERPSNGHAPGAPLATRRRVLEDRLRQADVDGIAPDRPDTTRQAASSMSRREYLDAVERILEHVSAGDVFQVNLTQRLTAPWDGDTIDLYVALARESPAPLGACLPMLGIASISPETFLHVVEGRVETRPIKGTRPRVRDPHLDAALADDLATSPKDRAENVMVVDMERNDLGRVCRPGTVQVPQLFSVEAHPTVWHLVSSVSGQLVDGVGYGALLRATYPCGSITGAPKVAAMRLVDTIEPVTRGWYCGAIGYLASGHASLSVAIRTATLTTDGTADYGAGGGIVADSDPVAEYEETLDKAAAFLRAVSATP